MTEGQRNEIEKVDGSLNITEKGDVNHVMQVFLNDANQKVHIDESITKEDVKKVYSHLKRRWELAYDAFSLVFPKTDAPPNIDSAPVLRGELELLSYDIARVKIMVARLNHHGVDGDLVRADEFKMAYMQPIEAFRQIDSDRAVARRASSPPSGGCFVVTATYGLYSAESVRVHRKCGDVFLRNPLLTCGWLLYRFYGPLLAHWARGSDQGLHFSRKFIGKPIVDATSPSRSTSIPALAYLFFLSIIGLLVFPLAVAGTGVAWLLRQDGGNAPS